MPADAELSDRRLKSGVGGLAVNVNREVVVTHAAQHGGGLDENVGALVLADSAGCDDAQAIRLQVSGARLGPGTVEPVGQDFGLLADAQATSLDFVEQAPAAGQVMAAELTVVLGDEHRRRLAPWHREVLHRRARFAAQMARHRVAKLPEPRHAQMVQAGEQAEAAEADQVVEIDDVWAELFEGREQSVNIVSVDVIRLHFCQCPRYAGRLRRPEGVVDVGELQTPMDMRCRSDRVARTGR